MQSEPPSSEIKRQPLSQEMLTLNDFVATCRIQSQLPTLVIDKLLIILEEYSQMQPALKRKEEEVSVLFKYNLKLIETVDNFIMHEKKIIQRCNNLSNLYVRSFKKYCDSKNWDLNLNQFKPVPSLFETFTMKDWVFHPEPPFSPQINKPYELQLLNTIKKHYAEDSEYFRRYLNRKFSQHIANEQQIPNLQQIQAQIRNYEQKLLHINENNMFDVMDAFQRAKATIDAYAEKDEEQDEKYTSCLTEMSIIHSLLQNSDLEQLKRQLVLEKEERKKIRKAKIKNQNQIQSNFQSAFLQKAELKEENEEFRRKIQELQSEKTKMKADCDYLQIKQQFAQSKKSSSFPITNNELIALQEQNKRAETTIAALKEIIERVESNQGKLRLKIISKMQSFGPYLDDQALTEGELFDLLCIMIDKAAETGEKPKKREIQSSSNPQDQSLQHDNSQINIDNIDDLFELCNRLTKLLSAYEEAPSKKFEVIVEKLLAQIVSLLRSMYSNESFLTIVPYCALLSQKKSEMKFCLNEVSHLYRPLTRIYIGSKGKQIFKTHPGVSASQSQNVFSSTEARDNGVLLRDLAFIQQLSDKFQDLKENPDANDIYWMYQKYKQSLHALELSERKIVAAENKKSNYLLQNPSNLSEKQLMEKVYVLTERNTLLEARLEEQRIQFETKISKKIMEMDKISQEILEGFRKEL